MVILRTLSKSRKDEIDLAVSDMLAKLDKGYPENSLVEIANANGIEVSFIEFDAIYFKDESGTIYFKDNIRWIIDNADNNAPKIFLNNEQSKTNLTLMLAHALGHYMLHDVEKYRVDKHEDIRQDSSEEAEADYFAVSLLVPRDKLTKILRETKAIDAIAKYFGVSNSEITTTFKTLERDI